MATAGGRNRDSMKPSMSYFCSMITEVVKTELDEITGAIEDIRNGKMVIVVDDEDRENEGDFIAAARHVTPEVINFMSKHGRGLICMALTEDRCEELELELMVHRSTDPRKTAFTVSVDLLGHGCTTGISAHDRSKTVQALVNPVFRPDDFGRPGHIFPLKAKKGGVLRRAGHTEATIDLARLAGLEPAGALVEIMNDDGTMARLPQLMEIAGRFGFKIISIKDLIAYRLKNETLIEKISEETIRTVFGDFSMSAYRQTIEDHEHLALVKGTWEPHEVVPVRVHSCNILSDIFGAVNAGHEEELRRAMKYIANAGKGVVVYMNHLQVNHPLSEEFRELHAIQHLEGEAGKKEKKPMDARDFGVGAQILRDLGVKRMALLTHHPVKRIGLEAFGIEVTDHVNDF